MPLLSGGNGAMGIFVPAAVLAALTAVFFGNTKTRLCAIFIVLAVALGDPLVVNTIKHAVSRPRPCVALPDVVERLGCSHSGSMPSAHAANWFAATMIVFLFNRKKKWLVGETLFMACAVAFSRVYNGVHYPFDVLAGAILGAGYAVALVIGLQSLWNLIGKKWFPAWHARLPSLIHSPQSTVRGVEAASDDSPFAIRHSSFQWLHLGYAFIIALLIARWIYIGSSVIQLSEDEAYQWTWSKHLALSYYSKPLGIAVIQFLGTHLFGDTAFGVRFFSPLFAAILSFIVFRFFAREINARAAFWLLLAVSAVPLLGVGSILMTIDPPLVLCWAWAMLAGWRALQPDGKTRDWLIAGLAMGLAFLCKYSAVYEIICFGIFFALWPQSRIHLRKPGPWLALFIFLLSLLPVIIWNAQHGWITVTHVEGNAGLNGHARIRTLDFLGAEFAILNPVFFIGMIWAMIGCWKFRREQPLWLYFFCMSVPVLLGHLAWSFHSRIQPNWIAPAVIPAFCLMVAYWDKKFRDGWRFAKPVFIAGVALGIFMVIILHQTGLLGKIVGRPLPMEKDPSRRLRGWSQSAAMVENVREKLAAEGKPAFVICSHYGITGEYSFYTPAARKGVNQLSPLIYSADSDVPKNQFFFWPEYDYVANRKGQNAIYVSEADLYKLNKGWLWKWLMRQPIHRTTPPPDQLPANIAAEFESVTDLGEQDVTIGKNVFHRLHLWACYNLK